MNTSKHCRKIYRLTDEEHDDVALERFKPLFNEEILGKKKYIRDLSKGNLKKVGIASAFFNNPEIVLLDEPFENLDPTSQNRLKKLITEEQGRKRALRS